MQQSHTECRAGGRTGRDSVHGVLCDRQMNVNIKGKVHRTVVTSALVYGAETWVMKKTQEIKLEVGEIRMSFDGCAELRSRKR